MGAPDWVSNVPGLCRSCRLAQLQSTQPLDIVAHPGLQIEARLPSEILLRSRNIEDGVVVDIEPERVHAWAYFDIGVRNDRPHRVGKLAEGLTLPLAML